MKKKTFQEAIVITEDFELASQTKIAYGDFLKRPQLSLSAFENAKILLLG